MTAIRTNTGHMIIERRWFRLIDLRDRLEAQLIAAGSDNVAFDMPPAFFTGSPWGTILLGLGAPEVKPPPEWHVELVPDAPEPWRSRKPLWKTLWPEVTP